MPIQIIARTEHAKRTKAYATYLNTLDYTPCKLTYQTQLFRHSSDNTHKQVDYLHQVDLDPSLSMTSHPIGCRLIANYIGAPDTSVHLAFLLHIFFTHSAAFLSV